jgi:putative flippase GtrA
MEGTEFFSQEFLFKLLKFSIVGFAGVIIDFSVTFICKEYLKVQKYVANGIGFTVAATSNYFFNRVWTFQSHNPQITLEFTRFFIVSLIGLGLTTFIVYAMNGKLKVNFYISKLVAMMFVTAWNFLINAYYTFA